MLEITKTFSFEAAHFQPNAPLGHPNARVHGHSFIADVTLAGEPDAVHGMIRNLDDVETAIAGVRDALDHRLLNEVEGLANPTLENIARFIHAKAKAILPEVIRVKIERPSYGQSCTFEKA